MVNWCQHEMWMELDSNLYIKNIPGLSYMIHTFDVVFTEEGNSTQMELVGKA